MGYRAHFTQHKSPGFTGTFVCAIFSEGIRNYASTRCRMIVALCPPKPNEFDIATRTSAFRA